MSLILEDNTYKKHNRDPTTYLEKTTRSKILKSNIPKEVFGTIIPRENSCQIPKLYGLPKIHKNGIPMRPIVSSINSPTQELARYLAKQLQPEVIKANSYVKNSEHFLSIIQNQLITENDILVSFDVTSLFTKIPVKESISIIMEKYHIDKSLVELIEHCVNNTYFTYDNQIFKQIQGAPMGSPLSPVLANIFMEQFEEKALASTHMKPKIWLRYIDDVFVIWSHGLVELDNFLCHLNSQHIDIKFTMEKEINNQLPFLDILLIKNNNQQYLEHTVYRKPTHTNRYLHANSHHHPCQLKSVATTLALRSKKLSDQKHIDSEINNLRQTLVNNGYNRYVIDKAINHKPNHLSNISTIVLPSAITILPYIRGITDKISYILKRHNIKTVFDTHCKIKNILKNPKDVINLENQGVYEIPCGSCNKTYIGQTNRKISTRVKEHKLSIRNQNKSSTIAQHVSETNHTIDFENTRSLAFETSSSHRTIREAIEIEKRSFAMNKRDDSQRLPHIWKCALNKYKISPPSLSTNI